MFKKMKSSLGGKKILLIGVIILAVVILSGCQNAGEKVAETIIDSAPGVDADIEDNTLTVNINDGSMTIGENATIPDDFPSDVYVIDGDVVSSLKLAEDETFQVQIQTSESYEDTISTYESELESEGWQINSNLTIGEVTSMIAEKGDRSTTVTISPADDLTNLMITTSVIPE